MFENIKPNSTRWFDLKDLVNENWMDIPNSRGVYQVSNYGRIKRICHTRYSNRYRTNGRTYQTKILKCSINKQGYVNFQMYNLDNTMTTFKVHRLVANLFIPNNKNKPQVNHIDGDKLNNKVDNLEWCTNSENGKHAWDNGLRTKRLGKDNKFSVKIDQFDLNNNYIKTWGSIGEITRELGISHSLITATCQGKQKTSRGYIWKYGGKQNELEI